MCTIYKILNVLLPLFALYVLVFLPLRYPKELFKRHHFNNMTPRQTRHMLYFLILVLIAGLYKYLSSRSDLVCS